MFKKILPVLAVLFISFSANAQRSWEGSYNRLGIKAGVNYFDILTDDFEIQGRPSWTAGFTTRSSFYEDFQFVYGISFYDFKVDLNGREKIAATTASEVIPFNMIGVQGNFFGSYKLLGHHLSIEAGPVVQVNGNLEPRQDRELYYLQDYDIQAIDIAKISPFNINMAIGASGGFETLKFWVVYQYGINNIFGRLEGENLQEKDPDLPSLEGKMTLLSGGVVIFL